MAENSRSLPVSFLNKKKKKKEMQNLYRNS